YQRDDVDNLIDRLNFSSTSTADEYISIDDDEINEMQPTRKFLVLLSKSKRNMLL
ncbi:3699_t:CDS:1, partial [Entrophospora sp. SA101]